MQGYFSDSIFKTISAPGIQKTFSQPPLGPASS